jgi:hypothetical protein
MVNFSAWLKNVFSDARMNRMTNIPNTGTVLEGLDKTKYGILICTEDGSTTKKDHTYLCNADGNALIDMQGLISHDHSSSTKGGDIINMFVSNAAFMDLTLTKTVDLLKANWIQTVTSTGTIEDSTDGTTGERSIRLRPNGTSGSGSTISYPHLKLNWGKISLFETKLRIENAANMAFNCGVGADDVTVGAPTITRKMQAEFCTVTNNNWWLRTADGTNQTASDTGVAISTNRVAIVLVNYPTIPRVDMYVDASVLQKGTNIPTSGATADNNIIKHSVKNSTGADRPIHHYGSRIRYYVNDQWI